jgi:uncharacterized protein involved in exopolysaccharide biosynthesis
MPRANSRRSAIGPRILLSWLPLFLAAGGAGAGLGWLHWGRTPAQYRASATIEILLPTASAGRDGESLGGGRSTMRPSLVDELRFMTTRPVLESVVQRSRMERFLRDHQPPLTQTDQLVGWLREPGRLTVEMAMDGAASSLVDVHAVCPDPEMAVAVVEALLDSYGWLRWKIEPGQAQPAEPEDDSQEAATDAIYAQFQQNYEALSEELTMLERTMPDGLVMADDRPVEVFGPMIQRFTDQIAGLQLRRAEASATIRYLREGLDAGRPARQILVGVQREGMLPTAQVESSPRPDANAATGRSDPEQERLAEVRSLRAQLAELGEQYGEGHPRVRMLTSRLQVLEADAPGTRRSRPLVSSVAEEAEEADPDAQLDRLLAGLREQLGRIDAELEVLQSDLDQATGISRQHRQWAERYALYREMLEQSRDILMQLDRPAGIAGTDEPQSAIVQRLEVDAAGTFIGPWAWQYILAGAAMCMAICFPVAYVVQHSRRW